MRAERTFFLLLAAPVVVACAVAVWPEPPATLLTPGTGWLVNGSPETAVGLAGIQPKSRFLRESLVRHADVRFFRTWTPSEGTRPLAVSSPRFKAAAHISATITGVTTGTGGDHAAWLEHADTGERIPLYKGSVHTNFNEVMVTVPQAWVGTDVTVRMDNDGCKNSGIGSVAAVSRLSVAKASFLGRVPVLIAAFGVFGFFLFMGAAAATASGREHLCVPCALLSLAIVSLVVFYAGTLLHACGVPPAAAVQVAYGSTIAGCAVALWWMGGHVRRRAWLMIKPYAGMWATSGLLMAAVCGAAGTGCGHWEPNYRFWPCTWSSDHELPWRLAEGIRTGDDLTTLFGGHWRPTDRPPLMAGAHLLVGDIISGMQSWNDGKHLTGVFYNAVAILLDALWIPTAWWMLLECCGSLGRRAMAAVTCFAATVPFSFFTTTYGWPKAFGAAFSLACFGLAWRQHCRPDEDPNGRIPCLAALAAASMLAHASAAFFLAPLGLFFLAGVRRRHLPAVLAGSLVAGSLMGSWDLYKRVVAPSHDPVTKFALTGSFGFDHPDWSVARAVRERYAGMSFAAWVRLKKEMVLDAVVPLRCADVGSLEVNARHAGPIAKFRAHDFHVPTGGNCAPLICILLAAIGCLRRPPSADGGAAAWTLIGVSSSGIALYLLICLAPAVLHHLPLAAWLGLALGGGACAKLATPRLFAIVMLVQCCYFAVVWLVHPFMHATVVDAFGIATSIATAAWAAARWRILVEPASAAGADAAAGTRLAAGRE